jgi:Methyltransferase domain
MYDLMLDTFKPTRDTSILDVGVSDQDGLEANMLEQQYPWLEQITCAGLGEGGSVQTSFPGIKYVSILPNQRLPFVNGQFDIFCSNAVLEHVGGPAQRKFFLEEAMRVAKAAFITIPHRWFPIEHHTAIPLLHWSPSLFRALTRRTRFAYWSDPENVDFLDERLLQREWPFSFPLQTRYTGLKLGIFSSNLALIAKQP